MDGTTSQFSSKASAVSNSDQGTPANLSTKQPHDSARAGKKRARDDEGSPDTTTAGLNGYSKTSLPTAASTKRTVTDEPKRKKQKTTVDHNDTSVQELVQQSHLASSDVGGDKRTDGDQPMTDTPDTEHSPNDDPNSQSTGMQTPSPPIGPDGLFDYPPRTPIDTIGSSKLPARKLKFIHWHLFDDIDQLAAARKLHDEDSNELLHTRTTQNRSKQFREGARKWYEEQKARLPWDLKNKAEKAALVNQGKGADDFPFIDPRTIGNGAAAPQAAASKKKAKTTAATKSQPRKPKAAPIATQQILKPETVAPPQAANHVAIPIAQPTVEDDNDASEPFSLYSVSEEDMAAQESSSEEEESEVEESQDESDEESEPEELPPPNFADRIVKHGPDEFNSTEPGITALDALFTAANAVGSLVRIKVDGCTLKLGKDALREHCQRFTSPSDDENMNDELELDLSMFPSDIVQAFIQCISPVPQARLPPLAFRPDEVDPYLDGQNRFAIIDESKKYSPWQMYWDMEECIQMHRLAVYMECSLVKDLVVDRMHWLFVESRKVGPTKSGFDLIALAKPEYINSLISDDDAPFLRLWADMMIEGLRDANPELLTWEMFGEPAKQAIADGLATPEVACLHGARQGDFCAQYHSHGHQPCHKEVANQINTDDVVEELYLTLRESAAERDSGTLEEMQRLVSRDEKRETNHEIEAILHQKSYVLEEEAMKLQLDIEDLEKEQQAAKFRRVSPSIFVVALNAALRRQSEIRKEMKMMWEKFDAYGTWSRKSNGEDREDACSEDRDGDDRSESGSGTDTEDEEMTDVEDDIDE
ncbi:hypothetical protein BU26DRAFT_566229 [Trematosphaeria pertusa]|uniref:Uncharacterized protein n=1 Tax=Trematosphaeria pertusa TaxID=390896 RepID=A0A6A6I9J4_9PLEO|nr:uncharacterized protein BU26DRAFT_566229 [Trematosphaeria pertusa]KAF2247244.1 hypothetical protein BU26DRAFT_566229 [Trematosphaeria pertusa]